MAAPPDQLHLFARLPGDVLALIAPDGRCTYVTPSVERTLGYDPDTWVALPNSELVHPDDEAALTDMWLGLFSTPGDEGRVEARVRHADGSWRWIDMIMINQLDDPAIGAIIANFRDVTERRVLEDELREGEERLTTLLTRAAEVFVILDHELRVTFASPALEPTLGFSAAELLGRDVTELLHPDDLDVSLERAAILLGGNQVGETTVVRARHADGTWRWLEVDGTDMSSDPVIGGMLISFRDITQQVEATRALEESESRFRALVTNSRDVIATMDTDGVVTWCTDGVLEMLGLDAANLVGIKAFDLVHPDDLERALDAFADATAEGGQNPPPPITLRLSHVDGRWIPVEIAGVAFAGDGLEAGTVLLNLRDVTWRTETAEALKYNEERLRRLIEHAPAVIDVVDAEGVIQWASSSAERVFGYHPDEMVGKVASELLHPGDVSFARDAYLETMRNPGSSIRFETRLRHADGTWRWCETVMVNRLDDPVLQGIVANFRDITDHVLAQRALRDSEGRFRSLAECSPVGIYQQDADGACVYVNERWQEITGLTADAALGDGWRRIIHSDDRARLGVDRSGSGGPDAPPGAPSDAPFRIVRPDGEVRWVVASTSPLVDADDGHRLGTVGAINDITPRVRAERDSQRLTDIFDATQDLVGIAARTGHFLYLNGAARRFLGLPPDGPVDGVHVTDAFPPDMVPMLTGQIMPELEEQDMWYGELRTAGADGAEMPVLAQFLVHRDNDGRFEFFSGVLHDISERKDFEHQLRHQATHDPLTGLPNRTLLLDRLDHALGRARRTGSPVAVLFLDLDHFKVVNDSLGHSLGDRILDILGERLGELIRPGDTVARFGGDEFVVLCEDIGVGTAAVAIAERVIRAVSEPFQIDDSEVFVGTSVGIALADGSKPGVTGESLIRDADAAMYRAKDKGRGRWELFDNAMRATAMDRLEIETALRRSLERRELRTLFQPVIDVRTGAISGVEALVRWEHPERGLLLPGEFIGVAETTGLIVPIGAWVLDAACRQVQRWLADHDGLSELRLAVNLSGRQLGSPDLVEQVRGALVDTGIDPALLELEITESVLMDDVEMSNQTLGQLKDLGVRLVVDDFGTGYSSLSYLRQFPVDGLKVDRSFVDGLGRDPSDSAIVAAVVNLAHTLGLDAVADGVETADQLEELRTLGCDRAQGFHMSRPTDSAGIDRLLARRARW